MEKFTKNRKRGGIALLLTIAALGVSGCGDNYSGDGNEFIVYGRVTDPGERSLTADIYRVEEARGEADDWFDDHGEHQLHDNCDCGGGFFGGRETVGHVENPYGYTVDPEEVAIGTCVRFIGKIRASREGKTSEDRPVYDVAEEVPCS